MGSKYKKKLETEWEGKALTDMKIKTMQIQANKNISRICKGGLLVKRRRRK